MIDIESLLPSDSRDESVVRAAKEALDQSGRGERLEQVFGKDATIILQSAFSTALQDCAKEPQPLSMDEIVEEVDRDLSWKYVTTIYFPDWKTWYAGIRKEANRTIPKTAPTGTRAAFRKAKVLERIMQLDPPSLQNLSERILQNKKWQRIHLFRERLNDKINLALAQPSLFAVEISEPRQGDVKGEGGRGTTPRSKLRQYADDGYTPYSVDNAAEGDTGVPKKPKRETEQGQE